MVEKYEMLRGGGTKQEMHPAPRKEYNFGSSGIYCLEETLQESPAKRQKTVHDHPQTLPQSSPSTPRSCTGQGRGASQPPQTPGPWGGGARSPQPRWTRSRPPTRSRSSSRWTGLTLRGSSTPPPPSQSSTAPPSQSSTLGSGSKPEDSKPMVMNCSELVLTAQNLEQGPQLANNTQDLTDQARKLRLHLLHHRPPLHQQNIVDQKSSAWPPLLEGASSSSLRGASERKYALLAEEGWSGTGSTTTTTTTRETSAMSTASSSSTTTEKQTATTTTTSTGRKSSSTTGGKAREESGRRSGRSGRGRKEDTVIFKFGPSQGDLPGDQEPGTWLGHPWTSRTSSSAPSSGGTRRASLLAGGMSLEEFQGVHEGPVRGRGLGSNRHDYSYQDPRGNAHARLPRCTINAAEHFGFWEDDNSADNRSVRAWTNESSESVED